MDDKEKIERLREQVEKSKRTIEHADKSINRAEEKNRKRYCHIQAKGQPMNDLSRNQKDMLLRLSKGDYPTTTIEGLFWADAPERVDGRTLQSLVKRGLVAVGFGAGSGIVIQGFSLTNRGEEIAKELDEAAFQERRARRGW